MSAAENQPKLFKLIKSSKEELTCRICSKIYVDPKKLECTHSFCKCCLDSSLKFLDDGSCEFACPTCGTKTHLSDVQTTNDIHTSSYAERLLEMYHELNDQLQDTKQGNIATTKCSGDKDCQKEVTLFCPDEIRYFCDNHNNNATSSYKSVRFDNKSNSLKTWCDRHSTFAEFICPDGTLMCLYCTQRDFKGHDYESVQDKYAEITSWMEEQEKKLPKVEKINNGIEAYKAKLGEAPDKLKKYLELRTLRILSDNYNKLKKIENKMMKEFTAYLDKHITKITTQEIPVKLFDTEKPVIQVIFEKENITKVAESLKIPSALEISVITGSGYNTLKPNINWREGPVKSLLDISLDDIPEEMAINYNLPEIIRPSEDDIRNLESFMTQVPEGWSGGNRDSVGSDSGPGIKKDSVDFGGDTSNSSGSPSFDSESIGSALSDEEISTCERSYQNRGSLYIFTLIKEEDIRTLHHLIPRHPEILNLHHETTNESLLHIAAVVDSRPVMELLTSHDAKKLKTKDSHYETVLHKAAYIQTTEVVKFVLEFDKSFINDQNTSGRTALHIAASKGNVDCIEILLKYGCDRKVVDMFGLTAAGVAIARSQEIIFNRSRKKMYKSLALRINQP